MPFKEFFKIFLNHDLKSYEPDYKKDIKFFEFFKNFLNGELKSNSSFENAICYFFILTFSSIFLLYLLAPFNLFFLKLLLVFKVIFFAAIALIIFLMKR